VIVRTPSQTIGPFFGMALPWPAGAALVPEGTAGAIRVRGRLLDGRGDPIVDGLLEIAQADSEGRFGHGFRGFGRCPTDREGTYSFVTLKPGPTQDRGGKWHAPHIAVGVFARGLLKRVCTRIYFPEEAAANASDPVLLAIADDAARSTLVASRDDGGYRFDIRLQGDDETVFFDL